MGHLGAIACTVCDGLGTNSRGKHCAWCYGARHEICRAHRCSAPATVEVGLGYDRMFYCKTCEMRMAALCDTPYSEWPALFANDAHERECDLESYERATILAESR